MSSSDPAPIDPSPRAAPLAPRERAIAASLIGALPDPVVMIDRGDRVVALNDAASALFPGLRPDLLLARGLRAPDALACIARARASGAPERATWLERVPVERFLELRAAPWTGPSGARSMILSLHDLSAARRVERMRVDFVANASHELRTPLASLLGFVETLQGPAREDAEARARFLQIMGEQATRMTRLVDDLLSLSRIEQHLHLAPQGVVDLAGVARHVATTLTPLATEQGVELDVEAEPATIVGDRDELVRVVENLVENAIKYGASEAAEGARKVEISVAARDRQGVLSVRDHGAGIPPEHLPRLTERFYRVDAGQSRAKGGTGLGLAIVKHIVARHRGRLNIESEPGAGSTFIVAIPLAAP